MTRTRRAFVYFGVVALAVGFASLVINALPFDSTIRQVIMLASLPAGAPLDSTIHQTVCLNPTTLALESCSTGSSGAALNPGSLGVGTGCTPGPSGTISIGCPTGPQTDNISIGYNSGTVTTPASQNDEMLGYFAGHSLTTGLNNTIVGAVAALRR